MATKITGSLDASKHRFGIVSARFNAFITGHLVEGALDALQRHGAKLESVVHVQVPGSWEIPLAARKLAETKRVDAIICLGCVIRGQTPHFDYVAGEAAKGVASASLQTGVPMSFGILTTETLEQAIDRAGAKAGNKGADAALAAIEMANLLDALTVPQAPARGARSISEPQAQARGARSISEPQAQARGARSEPQAQARGARRDNVKT